MICPLENVTCQCMVEGMKQNLVWKMQSQTIVQIDSDGRFTLSPTDSDIVATALSQENKILSNLSFTAQRWADDSMTVECFDDGENFMSASYAVVGKLFKANSYFYLTYA